MSELLSKAKESLLLWKLTKIKVALFSFATFALAWNTATNNIKIDTLSKWDLFNIFVCILGLWCTNMIAFVDKTAGAVASGRLPVGDDIPGKEMTVTTTTETAVKSELPG